MNKLARLLWIIPLIMVLVGCATPASRREELADKYPQWDQETLRLVSLGVVKVGMTKQQVREALKAPQVYDLKMQDDQWSYVDTFIYDRQAYQEQGKILFFRDDRVVRIRNFADIPNYMIHLEW